MHTAPAVSATLDAQGIERMLITLLHALAAVVLAAWVGLHAGLVGSWPTWIAGLVWSTAAATFGAWLARRALPANGTVLAWDGASWAVTTRSSRGRALAGSTCAGLRLPIQQLAVALDLGPWILLRLQADAGGARWQVVRAASAGPAWHGLRLALLTQAGPTGPRPARSAADRPGL